MPILFPNINQIRTATCWSGLQDHDHMVFVGARFFFVGLPGDRSALRAVNEEEND